MQQNKVKCAIYTRVSTDNQAEVEFNSCKTQESRIRSFISSQEKMDVFEVYSDEGYSGANIERPALMQMMGDIEQGRINVVVAYKIDRLTRSPKDFYQLIEVFDKYNVNFISVTERFDTSTPSGRLLRNIMLTFAQFERELISERTRDKMLERAKNGFWNSGHTPFGYKKENKKLVIEPMEAEIVRAIFKTYISTASTAEVYKKLKAEKIFNRKGLPFSIEDIRKLLKRIVYIGKVEYQGKVFQGIHEPIISENLFNEAQKLHGNRVKKSKTYNFSLFPGMVHCKECGSIMSAVFSNKIRKGERIRYFYYRCSVVCKRDNSFCGTRQVSADRLDAFVIENLDAISKNQQYLESLIFVLNHQPQGSQKGIEPEGVTSGYTVERVRETLKNITNVSKLKTKIEKEIIIKKHIKNIIYSKEAIEVNLLYSDYGEPGDGSPSPFGLRRKNRHNKSTSAAFFWTAAKKCRRPLFNNEKTANIKNSTVRFNNLVAPRGIEPLSWP